MLRNMEMTSELKTRVAAHVKDDVGYPATCGDLVTACNNMSEFSQGEKDWFAKALPHGTFKSPDEVNRAVGI